MILDSSAIVAILMEEADSSHLLEKLQGSEPVGVGAPTLLEAAVVLTFRLGARAREHLDRFLVEVDAVVIPFSEVHWREAFAAYERFGKGRHHAGLNLGDCLSYATAKLAQQPLLCIGNDFPKTDLELA